MTCVLPTHRLLASDRCGWKVCELIDGAVHLVLGIPGLIFSREDFLIFVELLDVADGPLPSCDVTLARASPTRAICYLIAHERLVVQFDQCLISIRPNDFALLAALSRKALTALDVPPIGADMLVLQGCSRWN
ncbi:MAG: hypothetical protein MI924_14390 [Chloroflexales bacterium]|nr:hypothetical protein [Chloroflexales bacterium]